MRKLQGIASRGCGKGRDLAGKPYLFRDLRFLFRILAHPVRASAGFIRA
jgi:hypothetical protein